MAEKWLFGYGSLIWKPDFDYIEKRVAQVDGWARRFWQGSHDHRGTPDAPGRVVTLIRAADASTGGMAFRVSDVLFEEILKKLDHREKNGYERQMLPCRLRSGRGDFAANAQITALVYLATETNPAWLGDAPLAAMAAQIKRSHGPSGANRDYLLELAAALDANCMSDPHVTALADLM